jgi:hypothetical protein
VRRPAELNRIDCQYENKPKGGYRRAEENLVHRSSPAATQTEGKWLEALMVPVPRLNGRASAYFTASQ